MLTVLRKAVTNECIRLGRSDIAHQDEARHVGEWLRILNRELAEPSNEDNVLKIQEEFFYSLLVIGHYAQEAIDLLHQLQADPPSEDEKTALQSSRLGLNVRLVVNDLIKTSREVPDSGAGHVAQWLKRLHHSFFVSQDGVHDTALFPGDMIQAEIVDSLHALIDYVQSAADHLASQSP